MARHGVASGLPVSPVKNERAVFFFYCHDALNFKIIYSCLNGQRRNPAALTIPRIGRSLITITAKRIFESFPSMNYSFIDNIVNLRPSSPRGEKFLNKGDRLGTHRTTTKHRHFDVRGAKLF